MVTKRKPDKDENLMKKDDDKKCNGLQTQKHKVSYAAMVMVTPTQSISKYTDTSGTH